jgi:hypothetical protein
VVPSDTDDVVILGSHSITVSVDRTINSIVFDAASSTASYLDIAAEATLTVTAGGTGNNRANGNRYRYQPGGGTLECDSLTVGGTTTPTSTRTTRLTTTLSNLVVSGDLTIRSLRSGFSSVNAQLKLNSGWVTVGGSAVLNADTSSTSTLAMNNAPQTGTLELTGTTPFSTPGAGTETFNLTELRYVISSGAAQTVRATTYRT